MIGVGGAVLGGAGKTPVAAAIAREMGRRGARVALIAHAYRAAPRVARRVRSNDRPEIVGDDALTCARQLEADDVPVIVAPSRSAALSYARASGAEILVIDGLLQASPERVTDALLVLDAGSPWGSGLFPPLGDLRAPRGALLAAADRAVAVVDSAGGAPTSADLPEGAIALRSSIEGASDASGIHLDLTSIARENLGLLVGVARPERILAALARRGINPSAVFTFPDHASFTGLHEDALPPVAAWLTTARCSTKLPAHLAGAPVLALSHRIDVAPLCDALLERQTFA